MIEEKGGEGLQEGKGGFRKEVEMDLRKETENSGKSWRWIKGRKNRIQETVKE